MLSRISGVTALSGFIEESMHFHCLKSSWLEIALYISSATEELNSVMNNSMVFCLFSKDDKNCFRYDKNCC